MKDKTCTITKLGICNKYKEVTTTFSKDDRIPGLNFKLKNKKLSLSQKTIVGIQIEELSFLLCPKL